LRKKAIFVFSLSQKGQHKVCWLAMDIKIYI